jgi:hypothetical protein
VWAGRVRQLGFGRVGRGRVRKGRVRFGLAGVVRYDRV